MHQTIDATAIQNARAASSAELRAHYGREAASLTSSSVRLFLERNQAQPGADTSLGEATAPLPTTRKVGDVTVPVPRR